MAGPGQRGRALPGRFGAWIQVFRCDGFWQEIQPDEEDRAV